MREAQFFAYLRGSACCVVVDAASKSVELDNLLRSWLKGWLIVTSARQERRVVQRFGQCVQRSLSTLFIARKPNALSQNVTVSGPKRTHGHDLVL
jgi:hypothetical protein